MDFFQPGNMLPKRWGLFTGYTLAPLSQLLIDVDPVNANRIEYAFRALLKKANIDIIEDEKWAAMMAREVIYPTPGAIESDYDACSFEKENSLEQFADLWRSDCAPSETEILKWVHTYGLPCRSPSANSLSISNSIERYDYCEALRINLRIATCLQYAVSRNAHFKDATARFRWENIMFTEVFISLSKETHSALILYDLISNGGTRDGLDSALKDDILATSVPVLNEKQALFRVKMMIGPITKIRRKGISPYFRNPPFHDAAQMSSYLERTSEYDFVGSSSYFTETGNPFNAAVQMSSYLKNIIDARLTGLRMTLQWVESAKKPFVVINYAIQAEDLLTVMWARFYNMIVSNAPISRCPCGKVFTKSMANQKYCDKPCQNRLNQKQYRGKKKATILSDTKLL